MLDKKLWRIITIGFDIKKLYEMIYDIYITEKFFLMKKIIFHYNEPHAFMSVFIHLQIISKSEVRIFLQVLEKN